MAQMPSSMTFAGESTATVSTSTLSSASDTVLFSMASMAAGDITIPAISGGQMGTIPSFTIEGAAFSMGANHVVTFSDQTFSSSVTVDGAEKQIAGSSLTGEYSMADNSLTLTAVFKYGSMPLEITYKVTAYYVKTFSGSVKVVVGGTYTYYNTSVAYKIRKYVKDNVETADVEVPEYTLTGTVMGDLTVGRYVVSGLTQDDEKGGLYRDYKNDGLKVHFTAERSDGTKSMDADYDFNSEKDNNILVTYSDGQLASVVNNFQIGAMPFPIVSTFTNSASADGINDIVAPESLSDGHTYDLGGRRIGDGAKGLAIRGGKLSFRK